MMSASCCQPEDQGKTSISPRYRRVLWLALLINLLMFGVEIVGGLKAGSVSLLADAVDFAGDAANYGLSLAVLAMGLAHRARVALFKGLAMTAFGFFVLVKAGWATLNGLPPEPWLMGAIAILALFANLGVAAMLYAYRNGDANMRSVWLCSRNDAISNLAVLLAAAGVWGSSSNWPDLVVAAIMAGLAFYSGIAVIRQARSELAQVQRD